MFFSIAIILRSCYVAHIEVVWLCCCCLFIMPTNWAYVANWAYDWLLRMLSLLARWTNNNNSQKYQERSLGSTFSIYPRFSNGSHYSNFAYWCLKLDTETLVSIYFKKITVRVLDSETELYLIAIMDQIYLKQSESFTVKAGGDFMGTLWAD